MESIELFWCRNGESGFINKFLPLASNVFDIEVEINFAELEKFRNNYIMGYVFSEIFNKTEIFFRLC